MEDSVSHTWADEPEGGYTVTPPIKLNPEDWPDLTPEQVEKLQGWAEDAGRELRSYRARWGVRMPNGDLHYRLSQGDAENLAVITDGQLVRWSNDGWEDQE